LLTSLSQAAKCRLEDKPRFGYAKLTYRNDGRSLKVAIDPSSLTKECAAVLGALARTALADSDRFSPAEHEQWLVVPFTKAFAACTEPPDGGWMPFSVLPTPPKKIKHVPPAYPADMLASGTSGVVIAEGLITAAGCIAMLRVTQTATLSLDLAAIRAVTDWGFEPARREGDPIQTLMTLTVTFKVR
jgi:TonB family protein